MVTGISKETSIIITTPVFMVAIFILSDSVFRNCKETHRKCIVGENVGVPIDQSNGVINSAVGAVFPPLS